MKMMETMSGDNNFELSNEELRLIIAGLGELPTKMSIKLFLKIDNELRRREQGEQDGG